MAGGPGGVELLRQLLEASAVASSQMQVELNELDLTESSAALLWLLDPAGPLLAMREIARRLACDPSNVTLISDRLQRKGLVERTMHPDDGRARVLVLTESGQALRKLMLTRLGHLAWTTGLTAAEQAELSRLLAKTHAGDGAAASPS